MLPLNNKVGAQALGAAAAGLVWTLLATFNSAVQGMDAGTLASVTASSALIVGAFLGWLAPSGMLESAKPAVEPPPMPYAPPGPTEPVEAHIVDGRFVAPNQPDA